MAEPLIVARLQDKLDIQVAAEADLESGAASRQVAPRVDVIFTGFTVPEQRQDAARIELRWMLAVAVRTARGAVAARRTAGPLIAETLVALLGWRPDADHAPIRIQPAGAPLYAADWCYFPLLISRGK